MLDDLILDDNPLREAEPEPFDLQAAVQSIVRDAVQFDQQDLAPDRAKATKYYKGEPFGDEEDGRSKVVLTEVRNGVLRVLDSLMPVFFGAERVVEFMPRGPEDDANARQMTDYVNYVLTEDNNGFLTCYEAWKDALIRKRGVIKWWWEEAEEQAEVAEGLTTDQIALLQSQGITAEILSQQPQPDQSVTFTVRLTKTTKEGRACVGAVPSEEFLVSRDARNQKDALAVIHRRDMRRSDLLALGISEADLDEYGSASNNAANEDALARAPKGDAMPSNPPTEDSEPILYCEVYAYLPDEGDPVVRHRRICTIGEGYHVVFNDLWPDRPFAIYVPDPEPHTMVGLSLADSLMPSQNIKSHIMRYVLDSAARTLFPRTAVNENTVNLTDAQNTENGGTVRVRGNPRDNMMDLVTPFIGGQMLPLMDYVDHTVQQATGQSDASAGLDPDALQSSTRTAVEATVQAAQKRLALLCRIFAETGHKQLMRGLANLLHRHQPKARLVRLRNEWVSVDPQTWSPDQDVTVSVALGTGQTETRMAILYQIAAKQEQLLQMAGMSNPACGLPQLLNTYDDILELAGKKNVARYFNQLPPDWQPPQAPPKPTPEEVLAKVEMDKLVEQSEARKASDALKHQQMMMQDDRERDKTRVDAFLKAMEIELKYNTKMDETQIKQLEQLVVARAEAQSPTQES